jgi:YVTN family beta-propeller protein
MAARRIETRLVAAIVQTLGALTVLAGCSGAVRRAEAPGAAQVGEGNRVVATIALPDYGTDVAASADGRVYVPVRTGKLVVIDPKTSTVAAAIALDGQPYAVAVTPGGRRAYIVDVLGQYVTVVTTGAMRVKTRIPIGTIQRPSLRPSAAASRDGRRVYVADTARDHLLVIATDTDQVSKDLFLDIHPAGVDISPDGRFVYVAGCRLACIDGTLLEIDTGTYAITRRIPLGVSPSGLVLTPDGRRAYLPNGADASVTALNLATQIDTKIPVGPEPIGIAIDRNGARVYATSFRAGTLAVIATATDQVVASLPVGKTPRAVAISADGTRAFVTSSASVLSIVDVSGLGRGRLSSVGNAHDCGR